MFFASIESHTRRNASTQDRRRQPLALSCGKDAKGRYIE